MLFRVPLWMRDLAAVFIVGGASLGPSIHRGERWWITVPLSLVATVAIYFRRRWPVP